MILSYQYGYHISALNQLQAVLTCQNAVPQTYYGLPTCIPMSDATFSLVTSLFTVGGLLGSLFANLAMDRYGRKGACRLSAVFNAAGAAMSGLAPSVAPMALGRFVSFPDFKNMYLDNSVAQVTRRCSCGNWHLCRPYLSFRDCSTQNQRESR